MSITIRGQSLGLQNIIAGSSGKRNPDGTVNCDLTFAIPKESLYRLLPRRGITQHPYLNDFTCDDFSWVNPGKGDVILLKIVYIAILKDAAPTNNSLPPDIEVECQSIASEEPITSVPNFLKAAGSLQAIAAPTDGSWPIEAGAAGTVLTVDPATGMFPVNATTKAPLKISNGAVFDTQGQNKDPMNSQTYNAQVGRFLYFAPGSKFVGCESVLIPRGEYRFSYATASVPNLSGVSRIGKPPGAPALNPAFPYNWLLVGRTYRRTGIIYRVTESWRVSGPRGWLEEIYGTPLA